MKRPMTIAALALLIVGCSGQGGETGSPSQIATRAESTASSAPVIESGTPTPSASQLPDLDMPGYGLSPAGEYGWTGELGSRAGMHSVVDLGDGRYRMTQMVFAVENDCFASGEGPERVPVTVAGLDGWYVEPYDGPGVLFMTEREVGQTTGAYALPIGDRTLCVYLTWDQTTTADELDAAREVVESIRGQANGPSGIRIVFTLPAGWDIG
ncbi:MAG: hypothetical protein AABM41_09260 [Chloroflexota bacterium]